MLCDQVCSSTAVFFVVTKCHQVCSLTVVYLIGMHFHQVHSSTAVFFPVMLCHWVCSSQKYEGTTFLTIIRHIPIHWNIFGIILIFSVALNAHNTTSYHTKFHTHNKIMFWDILICIFQYVCSVILWLVLMNEDETTWLPHWLPPLSCHCSDHMAATLASPTALLWCRPHGCHIGFSHCPAMVQTTWLSHCTDHSQLNKSLSVWLLFSSME